MPHCPQLPTRPRRAVYRSSGVRASALLLLVGALTGIGSGCHQETPFERHQREFREFQERAHRQEEDFQRRSDEKSREMLEDLKRRQQERQRGGR